MAASSVRVLAVYISCAILTLVMKTAWIFEPSSVQNTTANLSVDGSTSGNPIRKWKVIWSLWISNKYVPMWTVMWTNNTGETAAYRKEFQCLPRPVLPQFFIRFHSFCLFFPTMPLVSHFWRPSSCVWNVLMLLKLPLTFQQLSLPGMLIEIGMNCPDQKLVKPLKSRRDTIFSNWHIGWLQAWAGLLAKGAPMSKKMSLC